MVIKKMLLSISILILAFSAFSQESRDVYSTGVELPQRKIGIGYDEGISARYFINSKMGVLATIAFENLGGYDSTANNGGSLESETNFGMGVGFLYNLFQKNKIIVDALGQFLYYYDGGPSSNGVGSRNHIFFRAALAPEFVIVKRIGLGFKLGLEIHSEGESKREDGAGVIQDTDDGTIDIRFFGPANPFFGPSLGVSFFYYL